MNEVVLSVSSVQIISWSSFEMETERYLQPLEVISFFLESGGKVTNFDLVNRFKPLLSKTSIGQDNHAYLKREEEAIQQKNDFHFNRMSTIIESSVISELFQLLPISFEFRQNTLHKLNNHC